MIDHGFIQTKAKKTKKSKSKENESIADKDK